MLNKSMLVQQVVVDMDGWPLREKSKLINNNNYIVLPLLTH